MHICVSGPQKFHLLWYMFVALLKVHA